MPDAVVADPTRLRQVLINLVGNAVKFTEKGEVIVAVQMMNDECGMMNEDKARPETSSSIHHSSFIILHFEVADTGIGIPPDKVASIFEAFVQADGSTTRKYGGTGLGLSICRRLVEMMGGRLWAESAVGKGSTFHFTARFGVGTADEPPPPSSASLEGLAVLVVDDNATNCRILEEMLRQWGMHPTAVLSGPEALEALGRAAEAGEPFPLVLLDAMMPGMDGFMLAEEIRKRPELAGAAVMMLSSGDRRGDAERCRSLGLVRYLVKPVNQSDLLDALAQALSAPAPAVRQWARPQEAAPAGPTLRVLLAEDNLVNQRLAIRILEKQGHAVTPVLNGRDAVEALEKQAFDVVLMDVQMPILDGMEATARIRRREAGTSRRTPIIALTAHALKGDRERCLAAGMDAYLSKPIQAAELVRALADVASARAGTANPAGPICGPDLFDEQAALARLDGDSDLLRDVAGLFVTDAARMVEAVRSAVCAGDARGVQLSAHALKGSASTFSARALVEAAWALEQMGRRADLGGAAEALAALEREAARLRQALAEYAAAAGVPGDPTPMA